jgi:hypothetical protein
MAELILKGIGKTEKDAMGDLEKSLVETNDLLTKKEVPTLTDPKSVDYILRLDGGSNFNGTSYNSVVSDINKKFGDDYAINSVEIHNTYRVSDDQLNVSRPSKSPTSNNFGRAQSNSRSDLFNRF